MPDAVRPRLVACFQAVFPDLPEEEILAAESERLEIWDSVAALNLLTVIEQEFGVALPTSRLPELTSFERIEAFLK